MKHEKRKYITYFHFDTFTSLLMLTLILNILYCMVLITTRIKRPPNDISLIDLSVYQLTPLSICKFVIIVIYYKFCIFMFAIV